ncbi:MAG: alpha/beta fold hydrolase [Neisseriaceae bacterium]|nr:alpha/beta fold hydrolase [Neisseriaceae bacterium]
MIKIKKLLIIMFIFSILSLNGCLYFSQEKFIFVPTKLPENYSFDFINPFEEINIKNQQGVNLNGLHFYAQNHYPSKGAILFLHGNANNIAQWGKISLFYTQLGYDFFVFDYQGYGKSGGKIRNEKELYGDIHQMVNYLLNRFEKDKITIMGYSIGSGLAAESANHFNLNRLILISPYFNFKQLAKQKAPIVPAFLVRYNIPTDEFLSNFVKRNPSKKILIVHGKNDKLIPIEHSKNLADLLKENIEFWQLDCGHNDIMTDYNFYKKMKEYLH